MQSSILVSFTYTKASLYALSKVQFSLLHFKSKMLYQLVCGCLILVGALSSLPEALRMVMLMIGCLALPSLYLPVRLATERVANHYAQQFPQVTYRFQRNNFTRIIDGKSDFFAYDTLVRLIEDKSYFYLVDQHLNVFLIEPSSIGNQRAIYQFKDLLTKETHLHWGALGSAWNLSIYKLFKK